ncbi:GNAT family N-acetyltransferase [Pseudomonas sp. CrR25]|nr:GNAT family N-acetyltransferase [Pseudomonas sp. CrR25]
MEIRLLQGAAIAPHLDDLARLRIDVFREFPYLYDGSLDYEAEYLQTYACSPDSLFVVVIDQGQVVGASTGVPLADETEALQRPFREVGWNTERVFYFGESVLLPAYRGQGLGVGFFTKREGFARRLGRFDFAAFCTVERSPAHPRRPPNYQPLDTFWANRGYSQHPELRTSMTWQDLDERQASAKPMSYWLKALRA